MLNALIAQRCKRCTSDSPGLTSESEVYPGSIAVSGNNAVGVVLLFLGILSLHSTQKTYNTYGVDLLTICITQGRLTPTLGYQTYNAFSVDSLLRRCSPQTIPYPRVACTIVWQPWAIKSATPTALTRLFHKTIKDNIRIHK